MVLDAIREYRDATTLMPTTRELARRLGCAQNNINNLINTLIEKGKLEKLPGKARALILVDEK
jgi:DNA-binding MarR family transcriptional regulator